jgi:hypothetical protein
MDHHLADPDLPIFVVSSHESWKDGWEDYQVIAILTPSSDIGRVKIMKRQMPL